MNDLYSPLYRVPASESKNSRTVFDCDALRRNASRIDFFVKIDVDTDVALKLAEMSPYPAAVKLGVMKQVANNKAVTLRQMKILLGWAADRAQR